MNIEQHYKDRGLLKPMENIQISNGGVLSTLIFSFLGEIVGYHLYNPFGSKTALEKDNMKYYTFLSGIKLQKGYKSSLWGLEHVKNDGSTIFLVEGIWDAISILQLGYTAVSCLGADPVPLKNQISLLKATHKVVVIADGDKAGRKLCKYGHDSYICEHGKDPNSLESSELEKILLKYI